MSFYRMAVRDWTSFGLVLLISLALSSCVSPFLNPPQSVQKGDLVGIWQIDYGRGKERLILNEDGSFQQIYEEVRDDQSSFTFTSHQSWWIEHLDKGYVRLHLPGAKYLALGTNWSGTGCCIDLFTGERLIVENELILHVRQDSSGQLLLHHLSANADAGFPIFARGSVYYRVDTP